MPESPTPSERPATGRAPTDASAEPPLPWSVRATAAIAWLVATLAILAGVNRWLSPEGRWMDLAFGIALASGAAYLGMALTRQGDFAWDACRRIAAATGAINAITMPVFLVAWMSGLIFASPAGGHSFQAHALLLATAVVATSTPWAIYFALSGENVRRWIGAPDAS